MKLTIKTAFRALIVPFLSATLTSMSMDPAPVPITRYKVKKHEATDSAEYGSSEIRDLIKNSCNIVVGPNEAIIYVKIKQPYSPEDLEASRELSLRQGLSQEQVEQRIASLSNNPYSTVLLPASSLLNKKNGDILATVTDRDTNTIQHLVYHDTKKNQFSKDLRDKIQQFKLTPSICVLNPRDDKEWETALNFFIDEQIIYFHNRQSFHGPKGYPNKMHFKPYGDSSVHQFVMQRPYGKPVTRPKQKLPNLIVETTDVETK